MSKTSTSNNGELVYESEDWGDDTKPEPAERTMGVAAVLRAIRQLDKTVGGLGVEVSAMRKSNAELDKTVGGLGSEVSAMRKSNAELAKTVARLPLRLAAWLLVSAGAMAVVGALIWWSKK